MGEVAIEVKGKVGNDGLKFYDGTQFCHLIVKYITRDDDRWKRFGLNKRDNDLLPTTKKLIISHD